MRWDLKKKFDKTQKLYEDVIYIICTKPITSNSKLPLLQNTAHAKDVYNTMPKYK